VTWLPQTYSLLDDPKTNFCVKISICTSICSRVQWSQLLYFFPWILCSKFTCRPKEMSWILSILCCFIKGLHKLEHTTIVLKVSRLIISRLRWTLCNSGKMHYEYGTFYDLSLLLMLVCLISAMRQGATENLVLLYRRSLGTLWTKVVFHFPE
jgi:hypothetical protein